MRCFENQSVAGCARQTQNRRPPGHALAASIRLDYRCRCVNIAAAHRPRTTIRTDDRFFRITTGFACSSIGADAAIGTDLARKKLTAIRTNRSISRRDVDINTKNVFRPVLLTYVRPKTAIPHATAPCSRRFIADGFRAMELGESGCVREP